MQVYQAPLRDMRFVLHELFGTTPLATHNGEKLERELVDSILDEAAKFTHDVLLPLNARGDAEGCRFENGVVRTPEGFREAYRLFREGGWTALACDPAYGGQGLPEIVNKLVEEMICSANLSFSLYPGLSRGAYQLLHEHGSAPLKSLYLPHLVDGSWSGTMCLTEAHCGTDLGLIRTRAVPDGEGAFRLNGNKIFISAGEHDLTENIIHFVLAKLPDAPPGTKGISLFLVPKFIPGPDGRPGERNGVVCTAIEHKMGINGSATCQLAFEDAKGWLIGAPHRGLPAMFTMMNSERLSVGIQGLAIAEAAYQSAVAYARERLQGRALSGAKHPEKPADPLLVHPDVRRMLMTMRAYVEGCRALSLWVAAAIDRAERGEGAEREQAADFTALMTPIVKALFTDLGFDAANLAVQVYGGHGYIKDHGVEQYVRDARIAMIYEGTNGIQALDLVGRKLPAHQGRYLRRFFHPVSAYIAERKAHRELGKMAAGMERAFGALQLASAFIAEKGLRDPEEAGAAAADYLRLFGLVALGYMWMRMAETALAALVRNPAPEEALFYQGKLTTARFFMERLLPQTNALYLAIKAGKEAMMALPEAAF
jgi:alkylation response protein AidB-like acyl-CoA dehydrogenase